MGKNGWAAALHLEHTNLHPDTLVEILEPIRLRSLPTVAKILFEAVFATEHPCLIEKMPEQGIPLRAPTYFLARDGIASVWSSNIKPGTGNIREGAIHQTDLNQVETLDENRSGIEVLLDDAAIKAYIEKTTTEAKRQRSQGALQALRRILRFVQRPRDSVETKMKEGVPSLQDEIPGGTINSCFGVHEITVGSLSVVIVDPIGGASPVGPARGARRRRLRRDFENAA